MQIESYKDCDIMVIGLTANSSSPYHQMVGLPSPTLYDVRFSNNTWVGYSSVRYSSVTIECMAL